MKRANVLILLCAVASLSYWFVSPELVEQLLVFRASRFVQGDVWTPLTALFVHANSLHLIGNMLFLYVFGNTLEDTLGGGKMAAAFFTGGILSFIPSALFYGSDAAMMGASAAIFTLTAVVMLTKPLKFSWLFLMPQGLVAILYFLYNISAAYYEIPGSVGYVAHVAGFLIGIPFGIVWSRRWIKNLLIAILLLTLYMILIFSVKSLLGSF